MENARQDRDQWVIVAAPATMLPLSAFPTLHALGALPASLP